MRELRGTNHVSPTLQPSLSMYLLCMVGQMSYTILSKLMPYTKQEVKHKFFLIAPIFSHSLSSWFAHFSFSAAFSFSNLDALHLLSVGKLNQRKKDDFCIEN